MTGLPNWRLKAGSCLGKLLVLLVFFAAAAALAWMLFLPAIFVQLLRQRTGFGVDVRSFAVNPISGRVVVRGLVISNPSSFPLKDGLQLTTFEANAVVGSFFGEQLVINDLVLDASKVTWVKRADGHTNFDVLKPGLAGAPLPLPPSARTGVLVRTLRLKVGALATAEYEGKDLRVREYRLGFDHTFRNVSDLKQLIVPEVVRALITSGAADGLGGFLPAGVGRSLSGAAGAGGSAAQPREIKPAGTLRGFLDKLEELRKP